MIDRIYRAYDPATRRMLYTTDADVSFSHDDSIAPQTGVPRRDYSLIHDRERGLTYRFEELEGGEVACSRISTAPNVHPQRLIVMSEVLGLVDAEGCDIYEGDVLEAPAPDSASPEYGIVKHCKPNDKSSAPTQWVLVTKDKNIPVENLTRPTRVGNLFEFLPYDVRYYLMDNWLVSPDMQKKQIAIERNEQRDSAKRLLDTFKNNEEVLSKRIVEEITSDPDSNLIGECLTQAIQRNNTPEGLRAIDETVTAITGWHLETLRSKVEHDLERLEREKMREERQKEQERKRSPQHNRGDSR